MTALRIAGLFAAWTLTATTLTGQGTARADTVRATCALDVPQPRQCALDRLGARLQQVTGSPEALAYDATLHRFRGTQSQRVLAADITYDVDSRDVRAEAVLIAPVAAVQVVPVRPASTTSAPAAGSSRPTTTTTTTTPAPATTSTTIPRPPATGNRTKGGKTPATTEPTAARDRAVSPLTPTRVVIGYATPMPIVFGLQRIVGSDTMRVLPSKVECRAPRRSGLTVVRTRIEPTGLVTCWVQLELRADSTRPVTLQAEMRFERSTTVGTAVIEPVRVALVAVRSTDAACNELAQRVNQELFGRGRPVVRWEDATRRVQLEHCEQLARLLPARNREIAPTGFYVRGEASEAGQDGELNPQVNGPFEFTITKAGADPMLEAVREVVDRLLKYKGL